jgi:hypothetical protein
MPDCQCRKMVHIVQIPGCCNMDGMSAWLRAFLTNLSLPIRMCCFTIFPYWIKDCPRINKPGSSGPISRYISLFTLHNHCSAGSWSWVKTSWKKLVDSNCNGPSVLKLCPLVSFQLMQLSGHWQIMFAKLPTGNPEWLSNCCDYLTPHTCCDILSSM